MWDWRANEISKMAFRSSSKVPAILLVLPCLFAQNSAILTIQPPQKASAKRGATVTAKLQVSLGSSYHVNSNKPHEEYLIPLRLEWMPAPLAVEVVTYPKPHDEKYTFSEKPLSVYTGDFEISTTFKVPADALAGPSILLGKLRYQACNNNMCFPPKTVEVKLPVTVQ